MIHNAVKHGGHWGVGINLPSEEPRVLVQLSDERHDVRLALDEKEATKLIEQLQRRLAQVKRWRLNSDGEMPPEGVTFSEWLKKILGDLYP